MIHVIAYQNFPDFFIITTANACTVLATFSFNGSSPNYDIINGSIPTTANACTIECTACSSDPTIPNPDIPDLSISTSANTGTMVTT